jgi:hypothetical protein
METSIRRLNRSSGNFTCLFEFTPARGTTARPLIGDDKLRMNFYDQTGKLVCASNEPGSSTIMIQEVSLR